MKKLVKKQIIAFIAILCITSIICSCFVSIIGLNNYTSIYINQNLYSDSNFDYIIPSPGKEQVAELESIEYIDNICPYYSSLINVKMGESSINTNVYFIDELKDLDNSPFSMERVLKSKNNNSNNIVFVDWIFANKNGVNIGDSISIGGFNYEVTRVYKPNSLIENGSIIICWNSELRTILNANNINYSGAWLKTNDLIQCEDYLKNEYIPNGRIREKGQAETDEQYQEYLDSFYANDFYKEITIISGNKKLADVKIADSKRLIIIIVLICCLLEMCILYFGILYIFFSKQSKIKFKKSIQSNVNNSHLLKKCIWMSSIGFSIFAYLLFSACIILLVNIFNYITYDNLIFYIIGSFVVSSLGLVMINMYLTRQNYKILKLKE